eukprot:TRINITY_DN7671_c0_g1_i1.p1 TRINITY_DN7671_c0_g1~~TRINITY_DN7671_c0_g1_i1.p1  ORF type:complete len:449 (+),score=96.06 TRINITY_DN7671_c0_g1_i1:82-1428(+)
MQIEESNLEKQVLRLECMQRDFQKKALVYQEIERYWRRCAFFVACILGLLPVLAGVTQLLPKELSPWMTLCISITNVCVVVMNVKMDMGERIADAAMAAKCFGGLATQVSFFLFTVECQPYKADATALLSQIRAVVECVETNMTYPEGLTYEVRMDARSPSSSAQLSPLFLSPASPSASPDAAGHRQLQPWGEPAPGPAEEGAMNPMHPLHEVLASAMRPGLYYAEDRGPPHLQEPWHEPPAAETQQQPGRKARQGRGAGGEGCGSSRVPDGGGAQRGEEQDGPFGVHVSTSHHLPGQPSAEGGRSAASDRRGKAPALQQRGFQPQHSDEDPVDTISSMARKKPARRRSQDHVDVGHPLPAVPEDGPRRTGAFSYADEEGEDVEDGEQQQRQAAAVPAAASSTTGSSHEVFEVQQGGGSIKAAALQQAVLVGAVSATQTSCDDASLLT